jgi:hypothetical protein
VVRNGGGACGRKLTMTKNNVMRVILSILAGLFLARALRTQEHAPTVDVCRADRAVWDNTEEQTDYMQQELKHLRDGIKNTNPIAKLSYREINLRILEMGNCASVDESNIHNYYEMLRFYKSVVNHRYESFLYRHHLFKQFNAEDAAGIFDKNVQADCAQNIGKS